MTRPRQVLDRRREADSGPVFLQGSARPVFRGSVHSGAVDYVCAHCREGVLAESIVPGQLWDVVLLCWRCGERSAAPRRPRGLPIGRRVVTPHRYTRAIVPAATVDLPDGMVLASVECQLQRAAELAGLSAPLMTEDKRTLEGPETFRQLLRRSRSVFGSLVEKVGRDHGDVARSGAVAIGLGISWIVRTRRRRRTRTLM